MAAKLDVPQATFRVDILWTDSRYRSGFIQTIAVILVMLSTLWLVDNVIRNLSALGKDFSFDFMPQPSSYDINQTLIDYTSRSSHATAAVVGLLNTLLIAVMGCVLATLLGVLAGVLRLSKNWIVARLMTVYVEVGRNVPPLIQILFFAAVLDETLPHPKQAAAHLGGFVVPTNRGFYFPAPVFHEGSSIVVLALFTAIFGAVWFGRWAIRRQEATGNYLPVFWSQLGMIVGITLVVYLATGMPIGLEYPEFKGFNFQGGIFARNSLVALTLALAFFTGSFIAETVRAGIISVSKGQTEAAYALGLPPARTMKLIILPQALRVIIPPLISEYLGLTKNSSLALAVGYMDATGTLGGITLNQTGKEMETLLLLMAFYLSISLAISFVMNLYNEQVKLFERAPVTGGGLSVLLLFDAICGPWTLLKRGDARMHDNYGIAGWLNLVVLLYTVTFVAMLHYVFIDDARPTYYSWSLAHQLVALALIALSGAAMMTALFKHYRFIDLAFFELVVFVLAILYGTPLGETAFGLVSGKLAVFLGLTGRLATIAYTVFGARPNITYFNRVRRT